MSECTVFKPFKISPDICDECGQEPESHSVKSPEMLPYREAIWKFMLQHGGPYNFYGAGPDTGSHYPERTRIVKHVDQCGLDLDKMGLPEMESKSYFNGTFTDHDYRTEVLMGYIVCLCGKYGYSQYSWERQNWCVSGKTLSQIIWHVVKAGDVS